MPLLHVKVSGAPDAALAKQIVEKVGALTKEVLKKRSEVTVVTVNFIPAGLWFIKQESLAELNRQSFHLRSNFQNPPM